MPTNQPAAALPPERKLLEHMAPPDVEECPDFKLPASFTFDPHNLEEQAEIERRKYNHLKSCRRCGGDDVTSRAAPSVSAAIATERERAARIADKEAQDATRDEALSNDDADRGRCHAAMKVAAAIRALPPDARAVDSDARVEQVAALCHEQWSGWMRYIFECCYYSGEDIVIPCEKFRRWQRQMKMAYLELPEKEKESDRVEARKILDALRALQPSILSESKGE